MSEDISYNSIEYVPSYKLINNLTQQQFWAIDFQEKNNLVVMSDAINIFIFRFEQGKLLELKAMRNIRGVKCLRFMRLSDQLCWGEVDGTIKIWKIENEINLVTLQVISKAHEDTVQSIIIDKAEYEMISCSHDKLIKIWRLNQCLWYCQQTLQSHRSKVMSIDLNNQQLVSCEYLNIIIIHFRQGQQWKKYQRIQIQDAGYQSCLINGSIAFQSAYGNLKIFSGKGLFNQCQEIQLQGEGSIIQSFGLKYNEQKQLLLSKKGNQINILKYQKNKLQKIQTINFDSSLIFGSITSDGKYLITHQNSSQQNNVEIREFDEQLLKF